MSEMEEALRRMRGDQHIIRVPAVEDPCEHVQQLDAVTPSGAGCQECLETGDTWLHLRLCMTCGHVGCCDGSKNKHATKHYHATGHPVVKSFEAGEHWLWCYVDGELMV